MDPLLDPIQSYGEWCLDVACCTFWLYNSWFIKVSSSHWTSKCGDYQGIWKYNFISRLLLTNLIIAYCTIMHFRLRNCAFLDCVDRSLHAKLYNRHGKRVRTKLLGYHIWTNLESFWLVCFRTLLGMGYESPATASLWNLLEHFNHVGIDWNDIWTFVTEFLWVLVG